MEDEDQEDATAQQLRRSTDPGDESGLDESEASLDKEVLFANYRQFLLGNERAAEQQSGTDDAHLTTAQALKDLKRLGREEEELIARSLDD